MDLCKSGRHLKANLTENNIPLICNRSFDYVFNQPAIAKETIIQRTQTSIHAHINQFSQAADLLIQLIDAGCADVINESAGTPQCGRKPRRARDKNGRTNRRSSANHYGDKRFFTWVSGNILNLTAYQKQNKQTKKF